jgi:hypothetical protein
VHGKANMGNLGTAQTIAFEGVVTITTSVNFDPNSVDFQMYGTYIPTGQYGVQLWQNLIPSTSRPECNAATVGSPFTVNGQADQSQDFACL